MKPRVVSRPFDLLLVLACVATAASTQAQSTVRITNIVASPATVALTWTSMGVGQAYSVQTRGFLGEGLWITLSDRRPWPTPFTEWKDDRVAGLPMAFYRVIAVPVAERGRVLSATRIQTLTTATIAVLLAGVGSAIRPQSGVEVYKFVYETLDPLGARTRASGVLALPQNANKPLPLASCQHGTRVLDSEVPTAAMTSERATGIAFATGGYAVVIADYLGLGDSPGLHPYHHARSEAIACVDLLRAARSWCAANNVGLSGELFLVGYSQGGHATMALHRELEAYHTNEFAITASAPMAGAYDLSGATLEDVLSGRPMRNPYYFGLLLAAYQDVYHLADSLADLLAPPYRSTLPPLLTGTSSSEQINAAMPAVVTNVLKPEVIWSLRKDPNHPLRVALRDNDLHHWTPRAPVRLYHCRGDQEVIFANSQVAYDSFRRRGAAQVELIDPLPDGDHGDCALPSLEWAKTWFDSLRR